MVSILVHLDQRMREKIIDEAMRLPYSFAEACSVRYKMMSKEEMRKMGIKSPDLIDGLTFPFVEGITYMAAEEAGTARRGEADYVMRVADEEFADIPE